MKNLRRTVCGTSQRENDKRRGGALIASFFLVLIVAMLGASFLQLSLSMTRRREHSNDAKQAVYLAEAGLADAYIGMGVAKTGNVGTEATPASFGGGLFWVEATDLGAGLRQLRSTALWGTGRASLGLVAELVEATAGETGFFWVSNIDVQPNSLFDSYDSSAGTYADQVAAGINNDQGHVGSNGEVTLNGGAQTTMVKDPSLSDSGSMLSGSMLSDSTLSVYDETSSFDETRVLGDVTPGVGYGVGITGAVSVTGATSPRSESLSLPPVEEPPIPLAPAYVHDDPLPLILTSGDTGYESLEIGTASQMIVVGPASLRVGSLKISSGAELLFDVSGGRVDVYVTELLDLKTGSIISNSADDPTKVTIQVSTAGPDPGANVLMNPDTAFVGSLYAPESEVRLKAGFECFGGVMARSVTFLGNVRMHRDLALASAENSLPRLLSWRVIDIPDRVAGSTGDPFKLLGVDASTLPAPKDAHQDQWLVLSYTDGVGVLSSYAGWENAFDWTNVSAVISGSRDGAGFGFVDAEPAPVVEPEPVLAPPPGAPGDWLWDTSLPVDDLAVWLIDASPLTISDLTDAVDRAPPLNPDDLLALLAANYPLDDLRGLYDKLIESSPLDTTQIKGTLLDNLPTGDAALVTATGSTRLADGDLRDLLIANSPLATRVLNGLNARVPALNAADYALVIAAQ